MPKIEVEHEVEHGAPLLCRLLHCRLAATVAKRQREAEAEEEEGLTERERQREEQIEDCRGELRNRSKRGGEGRRRCCRGEREAENEERERLRIEAFEGERRKGKEGN